MCVSSINLCQLRNTCPAMPPPTEGPSQARAHHTNSRSCYSRRYCHRCSRRPIRGARSARSCRPGHAVVCSGAGAAAAVAVCCCDGEGGSGSRGWGQWKGGTCSSFSCWWVHCAYACVCMMLRWMWSGSFPCACLMHPSPVCQSVI